MVAWPHSWLLKTACRSTQTLAFGYVTAPYVCNYISAFLHFLSRIVSIAAVFHPALNALWWLEEQFQQSPKLRTWNFIADPTFGWPHNLSMSLLPSPLPCLPHVQKGDHEKNRFCKMHWEWKMEPVKTSGKSHVREHYKDELCNMVLLIRCADQTFGDFSVEKALGKIRDL